jgi:hypothetical protein
MVHDDVWAASGLGPEDGVLCLPDLERRLGRLLTYEDFKPTTGTEWPGERVLPQAWTRYVLGRLKVARRPGAAGRSGTVPLRRKAHA